MSNGKGSRNRTSDYKRYRDHFDNVNFNEINDEDVCQSWKPISKTCRIDGQPCIGYKPCPKKVNNV